MNEIGLLAHLRDRFFVPPENLATETLAYILNSNDRACMAWNQLAQRIRPDLPEIRGFSTQITSVDDSGIPDLVGLADGGAQPFIGEMKFEAGLTSNQPVTYIRRLLETRQPGLLLFVVPARRAERVWGEIRRRCGLAGLELITDHPNTLTKLSASHDQVTMAVVTWQEVLSFIEDALRVDPDARALWDLRQLKAMCERQDREAFIPFANQDLDSRNGHRISQFVGLIYEVAEDVLVSEGIVQLQGLRRSSTAIFIGRWMNIAGWDCLLQVNWDYWAGYGHTPIWLELNDRHAKGYTALSDALALLLTHDPSRLLIFDGWRYVMPIYVKEGAGRDEVREDMAEQVRTIAALLRRAPRPTDDAMGPQSEVE